MQARGGIDLGGTKIQAVVLDAEHKVLGETRLPTPRSGGPAAVVLAMTAAMESAAEQASVGVRTLAGIGVGSPGHVDSVEGTVAGAGNLPDWMEPYPLVQALAKQLGAPIFLGNDVGVALDAEAYLGAGASYNSFVGVFWGTGIGGGVILHGRRWLGRGASGEIGHMVVVRGGAKCPCGRRGCVEAYAGRRAMENKARRDVERGARTKLFAIMARKDKPMLASGVFAKALEKRDRYTERLLQRAVNALGAGIASAVNLLDVEAVVIGGGLGLRLGIPYLAKLRDAMQPHLFVPARPPALHLAALGDFSGAIGASLLVPGARGDLERALAPLPQRLAANSPR